MAKKQKKKTPRKMIAQLKAMVDAGHSIAFDQYAGLYKLYQVTVYWDGKREHMNHSHYKDTDFGDAINTAYKAVFKDD